MYSGDSMDLEDMNDSLRKIVKGAGIVFAGTTIGLGLGFLSRMIIAMFLGPNDYGLISLAVAGFSIATTLCLLGLDQGIIRYVSYYKEKRDRKRIKGVIFSVMKISIPISLVISTIFFVGAEWLSINLFHEPRLIPVLRIFSIAVPFWVLTQIFLSITIGFQSMQYQVYVEHLFQNILRIIAIIVLLSLGFGVLGIAFAWVLSIIAMPFLAVYFLERKVFPIFSDREKYIPMEKELLSFSLPLIFAGMLALVTGWTDTLMLGYFTTTYYVGIYSAALPTAKLMLVVVRSFTVIFMPVITELHSKNKNEELKKIYSVVTKWILSIVLPLFLLMFLFSDSILRILFGEEYVAGAMALSILAFGFLISSALGPTGPVIRAWGETKQIFWIASLAACTNFILNLYLIPLYGITGAAIATASSLIAGSTLRLLFVYHIGKMQPFRKGFLKPIFTSIVAVLIMYGIVKYLFEPVTLYILIPMFFVFLMIYFFSLLLFKGFGQEDLMIMKAIETKVGIKFELMKKIIRRFL